MHQERFLSVLNLQCSFSLSSTRRSMENPFFIIDFSLAFCIWRAFFLLREPEFSVSTRNTRLRLGKNEENWSKRIDINKYAFIYFAITTFLTFVITSLRIRYHRNSTVDECTDDSHAWKWDLSHPSSNHAIRSFWRFSGIRNAKGLRSV